MTTTIHRDPSGADAWTLTDARPEDLAGLAESIWLFDGEAPTKRERHFPTGTLDLIVHFGGAGGPFRIVEGDPPGTCGATSVGGLLVEPMVVEAPPGPCRVLGARLTPAGARALLGLPLSELTGRTVDLPDVLGTAAHELAARCAEAAGAAEGRVPEDGAADHPNVAADPLDVAVRWIRARVRSAPPPDGCVSAAVRAIEQSCGGVRVSTLRERLGVSKTRLASSFWEEVGVTPKHFARIVRFRSAVAALRAGAGALSKLALACGYYDQPHMNAEFRAMSGVTPLELLAATRPHQVSLSGD